jgi:hypothetical protein
VALAPAALGHVVMRKVDDARKQAIYWLGAIWFVAGYGLVSLSMTKFHHYVLPAVPGLAIVIGCFLNEAWEKRDSRKLLVSALIGVPFLGVILADLVAVKNAPQRFLWLFSYDYVHSPVGRPWPAELEFRPWLVVLVSLVALTTIGLGIKKLLRASMVGLCLVSVAMTYFLLDVYMREVAPFWSQKYTLAEYYKRRASPEEKLLAYSMYWRGETFYSKNEIYEGPKTDRTVFDQDDADQQMKDWISNHRGRRVFILFERSRRGHVQGLLPAETRQTFKVVYEKNNKFSLAEAEI